MDIEEIIANFRYEYIVEIKNKSTKIKPVKENSWIRLRTNGNKTTLTIKEINEYEKKSGKVRFLLSSEADIISVDGTLSLEASKLVEENLDFIMPTLNFQSEVKLKNNKMKLIIRVITIVFSLFMVIGRLISGVHWFTDIVGGALLSAGLVMMYYSVSRRYCDKLVK